MSSRGETRDYQRGREGSDTKDDELDHYKAARTLLLPWIAVNEIVYYNSMTKILFGDTAEDHCLIVFVEFGPCAVVLQ